MDLISRQKAIDSLRAMQTYKLSEEDDMLLIDQAEAQTELMMLPSAQPEIIRCKDCKHRDHETNFCHGRGCPMNLVADDDFCSRAERRPDE